MTIQARLQIAAARILCSIVLLSFAKKYFIGFVSKQLYGNTANNSKQMPEPVNAKAKSTDAKL